MTGDVMGVIGVKRHHGPSHDSHHGRQLPRARLKLSWDFWWPVPASAGTIACRGAPVTPFACKICVHTNAQSKSTKRYINIKLIRLWIINHIMYTQHSSGFSIIAGSASLLCITFFYNNWLIGFYFGCRVYGKTLTSQRMDNCIFLYKWIEIGKRMQKYMSEETNGILQGTKWSTPRAGQMG